MPSIVLVALNARYSHTGYGLLCLRDALGELRPESVRLEFSIGQERGPIAEKIASVSPVVIGIGVYIWNRTVVEALIPLVRRLSPDAFVVLGGPEISYDTESALARSVDCVVCGEGEVIFADLCRRVLRGERGTIPRVVSAEPLPADALRSPLASYTDEDISNRVLYVETSRGCPFRCLYCLSARDQEVRLFDLARLFPELGRLIDRGARRLKFIDRSFNLYEKHAAAILSFLLEHWREGMQIHIEMTPTRPSKGLCDLFLRFPPGGLHIEVGVQTLSKAVARGVCRPCDPEAIKAAVRFLVDDVRADVHADLIAGLPGESAEQFRAGFDILAGMGASEIQVGILKKLHGSPMAESGAVPEMRFNENPPYEVLSTDAMSSDDLNEIRRFASHWERVFNRGHFPRALPLLMGQGESAYAMFDVFSRELAKEAGLHSIPLVIQCKVMLRVLLDSGVGDAESRSALRADYLCGGKRICLPGFLKRVM